MINPNEFQASESRLTDLYNHMKTDFDTYLPNTAVGEVHPPGRVVVKPLTQGKMDGYPVTDAYYYVLCYVPDSNPELIEPFVASIKEKMKGLYPMFLPCFNDTPPYHDVDVKGQMVSIMYKNHRKIIMD